MPLMISFSFKLYEFTSEEVSNLAEDSKGYSSNNYEHAVEV